MSATDSHPLRPHGAGRGRCRRRGSHAGPLAWLRKNLFASPLQHDPHARSRSYPRLGRVPPIINFFIGDAVWTGSDREACREDVIGRGRRLLGLHRASIDFFIYGFYPIAEHWRVNIFFVAPRHRRRAGCCGRRRRAARLGAVSSSSSSRSSPLSCSLAVALPRHRRRADRPVGRPARHAGRRRSSASSSRCRSASCSRSAGARSCRSCRLASVIFIELVRGVPLITVLFMASIMLPLFLPARHDGRQAAARRSSASRCSRPPTWPRWCAAACRRSRAASTRRAMALGLGYWKMMAFIILPQALKHRDPGHRQQLHQPVQGHDAGLDRRHLRPPPHRRGRRASIRTGRRRRPATPATSSRRIFYFICCFGMSRYSLSMERRLDTGHKR